LLFIPFGIYGLLYFQLFFNLIAYYINSVYSGRLIAYPIKEQIEDILPILMIAGTLGLTCYFLDMLLTTLYIPAVMQIGIVFIIYFGVYFGAGLLVKLSAIKDFNKLILKK